MPTYTLTEMTNLIADARQLPRGEWPQLHRAGRNWWNKGLLTPANLDGTDGEPARFDGATVAKACLFGVLADMGFDVATLRKAAAAMNEMAEYERGGGARYSKRGLEVAIDGIRAGEPWYLHLQLKSGANGTRDIVGSFQRTDAANVDPVAASILADEELVSGRRTLGRLVIPATELLAPLLKLIPVDGAPGEIAPDKTDSFSRDDEPHDAPLPPSMKDD